MAPISKKLAAIELKSYNSLVNRRNMNGYSSDSSNQGTSSETSNSSSHNMNLNNLAINQLRLNENTIPFHALQSLHAIGFGHASAQLNALNTINQSQLFSNLSSLSGLSSALNASTSTINSSPSSSNGLDNQIGKQYAKVNRVVLDKNSEEYRQRRARNNLAVKKSRNKSKRKTQETIERVKRLKDENEVLLEKIKIMEKEIDILKNVFREHEIKIKNLNISGCSLITIYNENYPSTFNKALADFNPDFRSL